MQIDFFYFLGCPKKQSRLHVDEILNFSTFFVNGHLKFTYALSTSKVKKKISIFQCKSIFEHNYINQYQKYFWPTFSTLSFSKLYIQYIIKSIYTMIVWQWLKKFQLYFFTFMCKNMTIITHTTTKGVHVCQVNSLVLVNGH
jgi:hypothetical protein